MHKNAILDEVQQLYSVSDRSGGTTSSRFGCTRQYLRQRSQHGSAAGGAGRDQNSAVLRSRSSECLICSLLSSYAVALGLPKDRGAFFS
jgi:hypothetical protein